jgi:protein-S-isoprenylcysteine O-methyltransferase Ste14
MRLFLVGTSLFLVYAAYCIWRVRAEYGSQQMLARPTVVAVWALYILHAVFTVYTAWRGLWPLPISKPLSIAGGGLLVIIGLGISAAGILTFRSLQRMSGVETNKLITSGIYRWSRNPQNVGWFLALLGVALMGRSGGALLLVAVFGLIVHIYIVYIEEDYLESVFEEEYRRYRATTARYLGFPRDVDNVAKDHGQKPQANATKAYNP